MQSSKLAMIVDGEPSFLGNKVYEIFKSWGFDRDKVKERTTWTGAEKGTSLFGEKLMLHLNLQDKKDMKDFVKLISDKKLNEDFNKDDWYGNGLIITCSTIQGAKKIKDLVDKSSGKFYKKETSSNRKQELLKQLSLSNETEKMIDYFVGEDYQMLLSFVNEIKKLPIEEQRKISPQKALTYFPPIPGSTLPWEFMKPLFDGNTEDSIKKFDRTIKNSHILVPLVFLQRQVSMLLRVAVARIEIPNNPKKLATEIGEKPYGAFWGVYNTARRTSLSNVKYSALAVLKLENDIKGNSHVDPENEFKATLATLGLLLNH